MRFHRSPPNSMKRRRTRSLFKYVVRKAVRHNRMNRFVSAWHAPPRTVGTRRGFIRTGGGPGYRLAKRNFSSNQRAVSMARKSRVRNILRSNPYRKFSKR